VNRRKALFAMGGLGTAGWLSAALAQQSGKAWRVGYVGAGSQIGNKPYIDSFLAGMEEHRYYLGRNLVLDPRFADAKPTRLLALAEEVIALKPNVLLGSSAGVAISMKNRTATIPIVLCTVSDAVGTGLAQSLARPGGNVTGLSLQLHELGAKHIEVMAELLPHAHGRAADRRNTAMGAQRILRAACKGCGRGEEDRRERASRGRA
jgi:putative ABC transport system substrate-binding protein